VNVPSGPATCLAICSRVLQPNNHSATMKSGATAAAAINFTTYDLLKQRFYGSDR
jgi:hypothetical protein